MCYVPCNHANLADVTLFLFVSPRFHALYYSDTNAHISEVILSLASGKLVAAHFHSTRLLASLLFVLSAFFFLFIIDACRNDMITTTFFRAEIVV